MNENRKRFEELSEEEMKKRALGLTVEQKKKLYFQEVATFDLQYDRTKLNHIQSNSDFLNGKSNYTGNIEHVKADEITFRKYLYFKPQYIDSSYQPHN